ncbi:Acyl-CoA-binding domain-containing protein [Quillaja saponaria]|uniref:Acyl-CoA-binding domain-containing protein n=1 Tax=Quillaja saponaria TaxID=32244 RepID=A0AAD7LYA0_QUISA|nr:Acyl-CoA-binding domain-containing protein [Quillaja saponaria]
MELIQELFVTASLALLLSFLVAKLVSMAMAGDAGQRDSVLRRRIVGEGIVMTEVQSGERLKVQGSEGERKVEFFVEELVEKVDEFGGEPIQVEKIVQGDITEEQGEFPGISTDDGLGEESDVVGLQERSCDSKSRKDIVLEESKVIDLSDKSLEETTGVDVLLSDKKGELDLEQVSADNVDESAQQRIDNRRLAEEIAVESHSKEIRVVESETNEANEEEEERFDFEDDDWEGIERSELEMVFSTASKFVIGAGSGNKDDPLAGIGNDQKMEFYGLHKVATEGPCHEPQPMALKVSARAKWNAWQRLGDMSPEAAMEKYITLLSDRVPGWMEDNSTGKSQPERTDTGILSSAAPNLSISSFHQPNLINEWEPERSLVQRKVI